jgi:hypothetical protein
MSEVGMWPASASDRLVVYVMGPSVGDSQVVLFPDGRVMVVDSCGLTASVLDKLGIQQIDLLVLTHSDRDHLTDMPNVIRRFDPKHVWVYPYPHHHKNFVARLNQSCSDGIEKSILVELASTFESIRELEDNARVESVLCNSEPWPDESSPFIVRAIAPGHNDTVKSDEWLYKVIERNAAGRFGLTEYAQSAFENKKRGDHANQLSIALSVVWKERRVLLCGDVEKAPAQKPLMGWGGVIENLRRKNRLNLVEKVDIIKVAHHGSYNAFDDTAWKLHCPGTNGCPQTVALIAPNSGHRLPQANTLRDIRLHAAAMGITSNAGEGATRALAEGWVSHPGPVGCLEEIDGVVAVVLYGDGRTELHAGSGGTFLKS